MLEMPCITCHIWTGHGKWQDSCRVMYLHSQLHHRKSVKTWIMYFQNRYTFLSVQQETAVTSFQSATISTSEEEQISGFVASNLGKLFKRFFFFKLFLQ